jgi:hypothetical protein
MCCALCKLNLNFARSELVYGLSADLMVPTLYLYLYLESWAYANLVLPSVVVQGSVPLVLWQAPGACLHMPRPWPIGSWLAGYPRRGTRLAVTCPNVAHL